MNFGWRSHCGCRDYWPLGLSFRLWILCRNNYPLHEREAVSFGARETHFELYIFFYFFQRLKSLTPMSRLYKHQKSRKNTNAVPLFPLLLFTSITSGHFTKGCRSGSDIQKCRRLALFAFLCFLNDVPIYRSRLLKCPHHRVVDSKKLMERKGVRVDISVFGSSSLSPSVFTSFSLT